MKKTLLRTSSGIEIETSVSELPVETALQPLFEAVDVKKGCIFSSGFDFPGRHSRWDIGFVNPALQFTCRKKHFELSALNEQGVRLLSLFAPVLAGNKDVESLTEADDRLSGTIRSTGRYFTEEERSRQPSIFSVLRAMSSLLHVEDEQAAHFGLYGAFGYDLVTQFEELKLRLPRQEEQPDCVLFLPLELTVVDRKREAAVTVQYSVRTPKGFTADAAGGGKDFVRPGADGSSGIACDHKPGEFAAKVGSVIEGAKRGDYFEVVLSQSFSTSFGDQPTRLFQRLAAINPSPYMFLLNFGSEQLVGASPEIYVRVTGKRYETCPIAGTVSRGETALEDADQVLTLLSSEKDESELTMCTDVDRNDMARVCVPGSVHIIGRRQLEFYSHLIHTVDHVEGTLRDEFDALDAFQTHMWACTVTGAPKPAALQAIEDLENSPRNWYSGAIGFLSFNGNINTGITLRTAQLKNGRAIMRAGATLLYGSIPELEEQETRTKAAAFLAALAGCSQEHPAKQKQPGTPGVIAGKRKVLLVDCKDSFVHNLAAYLRVLGAEVVTLRTGFPAELLDEIAPDLVLLSPGPGTPDEFGIPSLVGVLAGRGFPLFGVCLGHQGIGQHFGAKLGILPRPEHGKLSVITHNGAPLFRGLPEQIEAGRYHSLYLVAETVPACLEVTAHTMRPDPEKGDELIPMAIQHRSLPIASVQFHPESLMTLKKGAGYVILKNALESLT